jgi:hypothetical protein
MEDLENLEQQQRQIVPAAAVPAPHVNLPSFWPHMPDMWFVQAECIFASRRVTNSFDKYCLLVGALPHESLRLVMDLCRDPPQERPYEAVKARLMQSHELTEFQRVEKIMSMPPLGARRPSQLMAAMLELCPAGQNTSPFFTCCFLQRLPRELRILLSEADLTDLRRLTERADALHSHMRQEAAVAAVAALDIYEEEGDSSVAAVRERQQPQRREKKRDPKKAAMAEMEPELSRSARLASGLCISHWRFGAKAHSCIRPCTWAGNGLAGGN